MSDVVRTGENEGKEVDKALVVSSDLEEEMGYMGTEGRSSWNPKMKFQGLVFHNKALVVVGA